ncbi:OsmC family protein [Legionella hackeliae]|uniref:Peroxiredoxin osmC n=1 Tax=Legionella hackeliae TaxID=449 RepID=A0A0A8UMT8_LEGHA|nr:OsmC family protein [Legionella hackeliae]KTD10550.1 organic hydroperoxide resistance protein [Legionella hackeliae]CEK10053.1 Peroxiredoxin osmC [Legionella hackeliae]STX46779.1 organic hydroperoxide resistance protein [Legionella hackeliae]
MDRQGSAEWRGGIRDGNGLISTESGTLNKTQYSFKTRFEQGQGTNPEELIAAAHAGCFSMAFAAQLEKEGFKTERIQTTATVSLEKSAEGFSIPAIHLQVSARVPEVNAEAFQIAANTAKENCPVSKLMRAKITMNASLES